MVNPKANSYRALESALKDMAEDHVISGGPGPLYGAGWAQACKTWSEKLFKFLPVMGECEECGHEIVTPLKRLEGAQPQSSEPDNADLIERLRSSSIDSDLFDEVANALRGGPTSALSAKERAYVERLRDRADILLERVRMTELRDNQEALKELNAVRWAIEKLSPATALGESK